MIVLFTDFGVGGPYAGQMRAALARAAPQVPVIDLLHDAPAFDARASAYLLAALAPEFPEGSVFVCVVDPGVGTARRAVTLHADGRWYVGPDNGLFRVVAARARHAEWRAVAWRPPRLSNTFHGRDLFAPIAARIARGEPPPGERIEAPAAEQCIGNELWRPPRQRGESRRDAAHGRAAQPAQWPDDLAEIIYVDAYGNAWTGLRAGTLRTDVSLYANGQAFAPVRTFGEAAVGAAIWYENSSGVAELGVNCGNARQRFGLAVGTPVRVAV